MRKLALLLLAALAPTIVVAAPAPQPPINIVAAENFYGDIARQIGGPYVAVTSILNNPDQDPHLFEVSADVARAVSAANIVVYNGIDYDPWMQNLLDAARSAGRQTIEVAALAGRKAGDNPHVWYDVGTAVSYAAALAATLAAHDPAHAAFYRQNLATFQRSIHPIETKINLLRARLAGLPVTATEPIFGYMFNALGLKIRNQSFQLAIMNNTEPSAADIAGFETDLKTHRVSLLIYNSQASDITADLMRAIALAAGVPVVGATETEPAGKNYQAWMKSELDAVAAALPAVP